MNIEHTSQVQPVHGCSHTFALGKEENDPQLKLAQSPLHVR